MGVAKTKEEKEVPVKFADSMTYTDPNVIDPKTNKPKVTPYVPDSEKNAVSKARIQPAIVTANPGNVKGEV